jgi:hypothetical protein
MLVFSFLFLIVVLGGVHCGIYKSSYNISNRSYFFTSSIDSCTALLLKTDTISVLFYQKWINPFPLLFHPNNDKRACL